MLLRCVKLEKNWLHLRILKKIMELFQLKIVLTQFKRQVARNACTKGGESTDPCVVRDAMLPRSCSCGVNFGLCSITHPRQRRRLGSTIELCMPLHSLQRVVYLRNLFVNRRDHAVPRCKLVQLVELPRDKAQLANSCEPWLPLWFF